MKSPRPWLGRELPGGFRAGSWTGVSRRVYACGEQGVNINSASRIQPEAASPGRVSEGLPWWGMAGKPVTWHR